jgi:hypothetical protein
MVAAVSKLNDGAVGVAHGVVVMDPQPLQALDKTALKIAAA